MKQLFLFLIFSPSIYSQKTTELFNSAKLGESRELTIGLPASYEKNPDKKYPVLILLDGDYLFDPFYGALSYGEYWSDIPETIVVGINQNANNKREDDSDFDQNEGVPTGTGAKFFEFIGGEVLPFIEKKYRTAPFKIIAGHDLTAGFLNFFLYKDEPLFNAYISLSPDLVPGMENILPARLEVLKQPIFYYQSTAAGDLTKADNDIKTMQDNMKTVTNKNLNFKFDDFKSTSHYSLVLFSIPSALYHIFECYKPITPAEYDEKIVILKENQADYLEKKYDLISKTLGYNLQVRINDIKAIETAILQNKNYNELDKLAEIANKSYPKAMLGDYELALMYEKKGDTERAAKFYQLGFLKNEIGDLTKDIMMEKVDEMKKQSPKKGRKSVSEEKPVVEPVNEQTPELENKTETIKEEVKPK